MQEHHRQDEAFILALWNIGTLLTFNGNQQDRNLNSANIQQQVLQYLQMLPTAPLVLVLQDFKTASLSKPSTITGLRSITDILRLAFPNRRYEHQVIQVEDRRQGNRELSAVIYDSRCKLRNLHTVPLPGVADADIATRHAVTFDISVDMQGNHRQRQVSILAVHMPKETSADFLPVAGALANAINNAHRTLAVIMGDMNVPSVQFINVVQSRRLEAFQLGVPLGRSSRRQQLGNGPIDQIWLHQACLRSVASGIVEMDPYPQVFDHKLVYSQCIAVATARDAGVDDVANMFRTLAIEHRPTRPHRITFELEAEDMDEPGSMYDFADDKDHVAEEIFNELRAYHWGSYLRECILQEEGAIEQLWGAVEATVHVVPPVQVLLLSTRAFVIVPAELSAQDAQRQSIGLFDEDMLGVLGNHIAEFRQPPFFDDDEPLGADNMSLRWTVRNVVVG
jgi:hypothetical protein